MLRLLYKGVQILENRSFHLGFIRAVFELKAIQINGELHPIDEEKYSPGVVKAYNFIVSSKPANVFGFKLSEESENELIELAKKISEYTFDRKFTSLELID